MQKLYEENPIEAPAAMINSEINNMVGDLEQNLRYQGIKLDDYLKWTGKTISEFAEEAKPEAIKRVNTRILLKNIIRLESIDATEEEVADEIAAFAKQYGQTPEQVTEAVGASNIKYFKEDVQTKKAIELIYKEATVK